MIREKVQMGENVVAVVTKKNGTKKIFETRPSTFWGKLRSRFKW